MEKISNYHHNSTLYIPVKCTMQQSANGNMKHKTCDNKREVGLASPLHRRLPPVLQLYALWRFRLQL